MAGVIMVYLKYTLIILWRLANIVLLLTQAMLVCLFARETDVKTTHYGQPDIQRYRLPKWSV